MEGVMRRECFNLKDAITEFKLLSSRKNKRDLDMSKCPDEMNLLVFGPSGVGKSSLIRTFFIALARDFKASADLLKRHLVIRKLSQNEGTEKFTCLPLKPSQMSTVQSGRQEYRYKTLGVNLFDTRGQILMNEKEKKQLSMVIEGKIKNMSEVRQRDFRYAYLLWEFWKKDTELFPDDIMNSSVSFNEIPHALIFVLDGSVDEVLPGEDEARFYLEIFEQIISKGKTHPSPMKPSPSKEQRVAFCEFLDGMRGLE